MSASLSSAPSSSSRPEIILTSSILPSHHAGIAHCRLAACDPGWIFQRLYPPDKRLSREKRIAEVVHQRLLLSLFPPPSLREVIAVLPSSGQVIGYATWYAPVDRTSTLGEPLRGEIAHAAEARQKAEESETELVREVQASQELGWFERFKEELREVENRWSRGRGFWYLNVLAVDPAFNGLGIGSRLLAWGTDQAAADGVPCWLEATDEGRLLYDRRGWKVVDWCVLEDELAPGGRWRWPGMALGEFKDP